MWVRKFNEAVQSMDQFQTIILIRTTLWRKYEFSLKQWKNINSIAYDSGMAQGLVRQALYNFPEKETASIVRDSNVDV